VSIVEQLERRLERERRARKAAEAIAEEKTREIFEANIRLQQLNNHLEDVVRQRTTRPLRPVTKPYGQARRSRISLRA
jgi:hypothetical protein